MLAEPGRRFITDAGENSIVESLANGRVNLAAVLPVTSVPVGPFNPPLAAGIWRVTAGANPVLATGREARPERR